MDGRGRGGLGKLMPCPAHISARPAVDGDFAYHVDGERGLDSEAGLCNGFINSDCCGNDINHAS